MTKRVFITGYYGFGNTGDEAILISMVAHLRELQPDLQVTATSRTPEATSATVGIDAVFCHDAFAMLEAVRMADLVIIGGGGVFHDYLGIDPDLFLTDNQWGICLYTAPAVMAALYAKPVMLYAVGVGPLRSDDARKFTKAACDAATAITVRDAASARMLESIGVKPDRIAITLDPAFGLPVQKGRSTVRPEAKRPRIAVALREWSFGIQQKIWEQEVAAGLDLFLEQHSGEILFVPFQQLKSLPEDDRLVAERVRGLMKHKDRTSVLTSEISPQQMATVLGECDLVVGMRLHSLILGMLCHVPLLALSYDAKVDQVMDRVGLHAFTLQIRSIDRVALAGKVEEALAANRVADVSEFANEARQNARIAIEILDRGGKPYDPDPETISLLARGLRSQLRGARNLRHANQAAFAEQSRILAERDKGIAFLRSEAAAREQIIAEQKLAVEFLQNEVSHREGATAFLRIEIESRDEMIRERQSAIGFLQQESSATHAAIIFLREQMAHREKVISEREKAIEFLQQEIAAQEVGIRFLRDEVAHRENVISERASSIEFLEQQTAGQGAGITFLQGETAQREEVISEREKAIGFLQGQIAAQKAGITFLRDEVARREEVISERETAIEFLQHEVAARDAGAAAQLEGIAFLRDELAQREQVIGEREAEIARLRETVREIETKLSWLARWQLGRSRREGTDVESCTERSTGVNLGKHPRHGD